MDTIEETFTSELWEYSGKGSWHFVTLPEELATHIRFFKSGSPGFGSVRVEVKIGNSVWQTSLFPDSKRKSYLLPIKAAIRRAESISDGDTVTVGLRTL